MKLLRLTTGDSSAVFDSILNTDLIVEPNSQIALANASFTNSFRTITLTGKNNVIKFNAGSVERTANLSLSTYAGTETDGLRLGQDMVTQLNKQLTLSGKEFGGRFSIKPVGGKNRIAYLVSPYIFSGFKNQGNLTVEGDPGDPQIIINVPSIFPIATDDSNRLNMSLPIVKGAGVFRTQVNTMVQNGNADNGYRMILTPTPPFEISTGTISGDQEKYSIGIASDLTDTSLLRYIFRDGTGTTKTYEATPGAITRPSAATQDGSGFASPGNDVLDLQITGGRVRGIVHQAGGVTRVLFDVVYGGEDLYGIIVIKGIESTTEVYNPRYNANIDVPKSSINQNYISSLTIPEPPVARQANFILDLSGAIPLAEFLGFDSGSNNFVFERPNYTEVATFVSQLGLTLGASDSYIIQWLTSPLDSYDTLKKGEFSILKVIPNFNQTSDARKCNYEASNLTFIDLNNQYPLTLRNIKARILTDELLPIDTDHMSSITVLIKPKSESI